MKILVYLIELFFDTFFNCKMIRYRKVKEVLRQYDYNWVDSDFIHAYSPCGNESLNIYIIKDNSIYIDWDKTQGLSYSQGTVYHKVYKTKSGVDITNQILADVEDIHNLQPHEEGIIKLKYGLTKEDVSIPPVVREILGEEEYNRRYHD